jgi:hypothetical protein
MHPPPHPTIAPATNIVPQIVTRLLSLEIKFLVGHAVSLGDSPGFGAYIWSHRRCGVAIDADYLNWHHELDGDLD